jgi:hypothetical protein
MNTRKDTQVPVGATSRNRRRDFFRAALTGCGLLLAGCSNEAELSQARSAGYAAGLEEGKRIGREVGFSEGHAIGHETGLREGYQSGYASGKSDGEKAGRIAGDAEGHARGLEEGRWLGRRQFLTEAGPTALGAGVFATSFTFGSYLSYRALKRLTRERSKKLTTVIAERCTELVTLICNRLVVLARRVKAFLDRAALERDPERLKREMDALMTLMDQLQTDLTLIGSPAEELSRFLELRSVVKAELQRAFQQREWRYLVDLMQTARGEIQPFRHVDRSLEELDLTREELAGPLLKRHYFELAKQFHPDSGTGGDGERMARINRAVDILEHFLGLKSKQAAA